ncbi:hypothetical protein GW17_00039774 [Ensete ventricosum]|nr:hypothetical protein GW17_00039774 [Ensete ventricosum]
MGLGPGLKSDGMGGGGEWIPCSSLTSPSSLVITTTSTVNCGSTLSGSFTLHNQCSRCGVTGLSPCVDDAKMGFRCPPREVCRLSPRGSSLLRIPHCVEDLVCSASYRLLLLCNTHPVGRRNKKASVRENSARVLHSTRYGMMGDKGQDQGFEEASSSSSSSSSWRTVPLSPLPIISSLVDKASSTLHTLHLVTGQPLIVRVTSAPIIRPPHTMSTKRSMERSKEGMGWRVDRSPTSIIISPCFRPATTMPEAPKFLLSPASLPDEHRKALEFIEDVTANADQVQRRVLAEILAQNAPAEYLHRHGLPGRTAPDPDAFKRLIPVVTYEDIRPDILRIAHGDTSPILSGRPISEFLTRFAARSHMYPLGK